MIIFTETYFIYFIVPLMTVGLSIFLKFVTRNDQHISFQKEDMAFGIELSITALLIFIVSCSSFVSQSILPDAPKQLVDKVNSIPWILLCVIMGIWAVSTIVRKLGWEENGKLHIFWGISVPNFFGIILLLYIVDWIIP